MKALSELRQLATEERRLARRPHLVELLDAILELSLECPSCAARREAKRVAQAKWREKVRNG